MKPSGKAWPQLLADLAPAMLLRLSAALALGACACAAAMALDTRVLDNGHAVWAKPMRFCLAFAVHLFTLWCLGVLTRRQPLGDRWFAASAWLQAATAVIELLCITAQAARGVHSHFNYATPFDHAVFTVMGLGTALLLVGMVLMIAGLVRWPAGPAATCMTIGGLAVAVLGGLVGVWMVMPTPEQRLLLDGGLRLPWVGGTLSAPASGHTLPGFGWDLHIGDWRVPHFLGLHALQALPLLAWLHQRAGPDRGPVPTLLWLGAGAYTAAFLGAVLHTASGRSALDLGSGWLATVPVAALLLYLALALVLTRLKPR